MAVRREPVQPGGGNPYGGTTPTTRPPGAGKETKAEKERRLAAEKADAQLKRDLDKLRLQSGTLYYGVEAGSDLENMGITREAPGYRAPGQGMGGWGRNLTGPASRAPRYKVGYLGSDKFLKDELFNRNPEVIKSFQFYLHESGLLKKYQEGELDKPTKAAFKELLTTANQTGKTWQQVLGDTYAEGGVTDQTGEDERDPFQATLADPVYLRETFQKSVQTIYGGDLPDAEIDAMVDAFRSQQMAKQQAAYNAEGMGGTVEGTEMSPEAFATAAVKEKHPQQINRVKFQDAFDSILQTFTGGGQ